MSVAIANLVQMLCLNFCYDELLPVHSGLLLAHWKKAHSSHPTEPQISCS
jgi:hypothetical protein